MAEKCMHCTKKAIFKHETGYLCRNHFIKYIKQKVFKTIRLNELIVPGDKVAVGFSGGKDSAVVLYLLKEYCSKRNINLVAIHIDEGISKTHNKIMKIVNDFCKKHEIELYNFTFIDEYNKTFDEVVKKKPETIPCTMCGILRRNLINKKARELKITKLATGHNLSDEAQTLMMNAFQNKPELIARSGMMPGIIKDKKFIPRIKPLYFVKEEEVKLFAKLLKLNIPNIKCPYSSRSLRFQVKDHLEQLSKRFTHITSNIVRFNLQIKEMVQDKYKEQKLSKCSVCGEPSNKKICNKCLLLRELEK